MICDIKAALENEGFLVSTQAQEKIRYDGMQIVLSLDGLDIESETLETYRVGTRIAISFVMEKIEDIKEQVLKIIKVVEDRLRGLHCVLWKFEGSSVEMLGTGYLVSVFFTWSEVVEVK